MILTALVCDLPMRTLEPAPGATKLLHLLQNAIRSQYGMRARFLVAMALAAAACPAARPGSARAARTAARTSASIISIAASLSRAGLPMTEPTGRGP